jgi:hypothetical protein
MTSKPRNGPQSPESYPHPEPILLHSVRHSGDGCRSIPPQCDPEPVMTYSPSPGGRGGGAQGDNPNR